jgi:class 3 adenylate cyclase
LLQKPELDWVPVGSTVSPAVAADARVAPAPSPSGTVTFLFTDLEGSTRLWEQHGEAMRAALVRHDAALTDAVAAANGVVVKHTGDGIMAAFASAHDAVRAAIAAQHALAAHTDVPIAARMGIHTGVIEPQGNDYFGPILNRAARVMAIGHGGQVLVSQATEQLVRDALDDDIVLHDLGEHRLRDLLRPERVFQVGASGLPADFPDLRSLDALPGNLPSQLTSFVGRERELAALAEALARRDS